MDKIEKYLKSKQFRIDVSKIIESETWDKGLPKIYMKDGNIVEHWRDGTINILKTKEELNDL